MDVELIPGRELTARHCRLWEGIRAGRPALGSPYLSARFTLSAAWARDDVWVGILGQGGETLGFFPHQRGAAGEGFPVAYGVNDFQGPVTSAALRWKVQELLAGCGLVRWHFNHLVIDIEPLRPFHRLLGKSPFIDLGQGFDGYLEAQQRAGSRACKKIAAQARRLERDVGPLRFADAERDPELLWLLLEWKSRQVEERGDSHRFGRAWVRELFRRLQAVDTPALSGVLSTLRAGEQLVALHFGLRSRAPGRGSWHYWIPAYDPRFARYSPGHVLLLEIVRRAAEMGLARVDLGRGGGDYKRRLMTGCDEVAEGVVELAGDVGPPRRGG